MNQIDAIYTRQSVDRADSISIESQVEICKREVDQYKVYSDKGYSGKNTERPAFQAMMEDIRAGKIRKVVVYRLDRISRSVLDFASVNDTFETHNVSFVSTMEKFDTSTPIGKAMLMIVMIFAQLERETIQQRVLDAYHSRSKRGFFMGGCIPYGFDLVDTTIDGIHTKMYQPLPHQADIVRKVYALYAEPQTSLGDVARYLSEQGIVRPSGKPFNRSRIRDMVINPAYVRADYQLYQFYKSQGTDVINPPEDFIGTNGAYLYSGEIKKSKTTCLDGHKLVLAPHEGIVDSSDWIKCRSKCLNNNKVAKPLKAKATWLAGKIRCAHCGYALCAKVYHCKTKKDNRYYLCSHKNNTGNCTFSSLDADVVDEVIFGEMLEKLREFETLSKQEQSSCDFQTIKLNTRLETIETEITSLLDKVGQANDAVMDYINRRIAELDSEKKELYAQIAQLQEGNNKPLDAITGYMSQWEDISMADKLTVVDSLIESVVASKDKLQINWKI